MAGGDLYRGNPIVSVVPSSNQAADCKNPREVAYQGENQREQTRGVTGVSEEEVDLEGERVGPQTRSPKDTTRTRRTTQSHNWRDAEEEDGKLY